MRERRETQRREGMRLVCDAPNHDDVAGLPEAIAAVKGLLLRRLVPSRIHHEYVRALGEREPRAAALALHQQDGRAATGVGFLPPINLFLALLAAQLAVVAAELQARRL